MYKLYGLLTSESVVVRTVQWLKEQAINLLCYTVKWERGLLYVLTTEYVRAWYCERAVDA